MGVGHEGGGVWLRGFGLGHGLGKTGEGRVLRLAVRALGARRECAVDLEKRDAEAGWHVKIYCTPNC